MTRYNMQDEIRQLKSSRLITLINIHDRHLNKIRSVTQTHAHFDFHSSRLQRISADWNCYSDKTYYRCLIVLLQRKSLPSHIPVCAELQRLCGCTVGERKSHVYWRHMTSLLGSTAERLNAEACEEFFFFFFWSSLACSQHFSHCDSGRRHNRFLDQISDSLLQPVAFHSFQSLLNIFNGMEQAN